MLGALTPAIVDPQSRAAHAAARGLRFERVRQDLRAIVADVGGAPEKECRQS